jgi:hypothetical protein
LSGSPQAGRNRGLTGFAAALAALREVITAVSGWRQTGRKLRLNASVLGAYETAFVDPQMKDAAMIHP